MKKVIRLEDYKEGWRISKLKCRSCQKQTVNVYFKDYNNLECKCFGNKIRRLLNKTRFKISTHEKLYDYESDPYSDDCGC